MISSPANMVWNVKGEDAATAVLPAPAAKYDMPAPKPSMLTKIFSGGGIDGETDGGGWKWYHWVIAAVVLALLIWGSWYVYRKYFK